VRRVLLNGRVRVLACVYWGVRSWRAAVRHARFAAEAMVRERGWDIVLARLSVSLVWQCSKLKHGTVELRAASPNMPARESTTSLLGFSIIICHDSLWDTILTWIHTIASTDYCEDTDSRQRGDSLDRWAASGKARTQYALSQFSSRRELWSET
jgi:hypothetical protein